MISASYVRDGVTYAESLTYGREDFLHTYVKIFPNGESDFGTRVVSNRVARKIWARMNRA